MVADTLMKADLPKAESGSHSQKGGSPAIFLNFTVSELFLTLHPRKIYLEPASCSVKFGDNEKRLLLFFVSEICTIFTRTLRVLVKIGCIMAEPKMFHF